MASFRSKRGKQSTTPVEVPRAGVAVRKLTDPPVHRGEEPEPTPAPAHQPQPFHDPAAPVQRNPMQRVVLGPGAMYSVDTTTGEESLVGNVTELTLSFDPLDDLTVDPESEVAGEIARRAADDIDRQVMFGRGLSRDAGPLTHALDTALVNAFAYGDYESVVSRINLQQCHDWGSYVDSIDGEFYRDWDRRAALAPIRGPESDFRSATIQTHQGFRGTMAFHAAPGNASASLSAAAAAHFQTIREHLGDVVMALERRFVITYWRVAFIFCPDGFPALCGVVNSNAIGGGNTVSVVGASMRNGHVYRHVNADFGDTEGDAVADFLYQAHTDANPALQQYLRRRGR